ncbi:MAG: hypothetical protein DWQ34_04080 [Planctomycetota bacterium]|nr:MAG: hypothetical protein DWQ29_14340 [Planctomycetota bacterium]REJ96423.1 MAG: hypothetical protein DWQ34_04080 [Planctomycetota bacterium]REK29694.1 MAG: hypothetical protein DWQ41_03385 [Planctomycetota bacterium]REK30485.1 MAG: hypothetical protein DWQ45_21650 [Planctomycetota bacterium]
MFWTVLFLLHVLVTFVMAGVMWFVQIAYYPNLAVVGRDAFVGYQREHIRRVSGVAWTCLLWELATGLVLTACPFQDAPRWLLLGNAALILGVWASTWFVQVPLHHTLEGAGWDARVHASLVRTNWFRTITYTVRGLLVLYLLGLLIGP